jgi:predicted secreted acid phosphatase
MKNKLELQLAAQATAQKCRAAKTQRESAGIVLADFAETKLDDKHYETFALLVNEIIYQFAALEKILLEPAPAAPAE